MNSGEGMDADFDLSRLDDIPDARAAVDEPAAAPAAPARAAPAERAPTRVEVARGRAIALVAVVVWLTFQVVVLGFRGDFARLTGWYVAVQIALPAGLAVAALWAALTPGRDSLGAGASITRMIAVGAPMIFLVSTFGCPMPFAYEPPVGGLKFGQWALVCSDIVVVMGGLPLVVATLVLRRSFAALALWRSVAVAAACGLAAAVAMHFHCENLLPGHMLLSHAVPVALLALAGGLVLRRTSSV